jgi:Protein of unknown function (DUF1573)
MRIVLLLLLLGLGLAAAELENRNVAGPEAAPTFSEKTPFSAQVTVRNPHDRAAKVDRLDASCSCMQLALKDHFLLPHATTTLTITVDNANRSGIQRMGVTIYLTDPELEGIEVEVWWQVDPSIAVDAIAPLADPAHRPEDNGWRDVYRYVQHERPDELQRLRKRVRLASKLPDFAILGIDYLGPVWKFAPTRQADGSWLVTATAKTPDTPLPEKTYDEQVIIRTNHPDKPTVVLQFVAIIARNAGKEAVDLLAPMPPPAPVPAGP